jgi:hypothetical protein
MVINNGVVPNKAIGVLGGFNTSEGDFDITGTITAYFSSVDAVNAIKNNLDVCLQTIFARANAGMIFDLPLLTLGGGGAKVEKDKPIMVALTQSAAKCPNGYTLLANFGPGHGWVKARFTGQPEPKGGSVNCLFA